MKLDIFDPKTGITQVVYDLTTGIYSTKQINSELPCLSRGDSSPLECKCIDTKPTFNLLVEQIIKDHVEIDLPIDYRPDGYRRILPKLETLKELSGIITISNGILKELTYNSKQYLSPNLDVSSKHEASIDTRFQSDDKFILWHTHPSCEPTGSTDVKTFKDIISRFDELNPENCYDVRYIPKMDQFYWFTLKRKPFFRRIFRF